MGIPSLELFWFCDSSIGLLIHTSRAINPHRTRLQLSLFQPRLLLCPVRPQVGAILPAILLRITILHQSFPSHPAPAFCLCTTAKFVHVWPAVPTLSSPPLSSFKMAPKFVRSRTGAHLIIGSNRIFFKFLEFLHSTLASSKPYPILSLACATTYRTPMKSRSST